MINFILLLYSVVAVLGIFLFTKVISSKPPKLITGIIHGSLGLAGLAFIIGYISFQSGEAPVYGFLLLLTAFFFGGGMIATTLSGKKYHKAVLFIHVIMALTGLYLLFSFALNKY